MIFEDRLVASNYALATFMKGVRLEAVDGKIAVSWPKYGDKTGRLRERKVWVTRGSGHYPTWSEKAPWGGTKFVALSMLVRWCQNKPIYGISVWRGWCEQLRDEKTCQALEAAGYPLTNTCILCGLEIKNGLDWYHDKKINGPCCSMATCTNFDEREKLAKTPSASHPWRKAYSSS